MFVCGSDHLNTPTWYTSYCLSYDQITCNYTILDKKYITALWLNCVVKLIGTVKYLSHDGAGIHSTNAIWPSSKFHENLLSLKFEDAYSDHKRIRKYQGCSAKVAEQS